MTRLLVYSDSSYEFLVPSSELSKDVPTSGAELQARAERRAASLREGEAKAERHREALRATARPITLGDYLGHNGPQTLREAAEAVESFAG